MPQAAVVVATLRAMLTTLATGSRARAPADVRQAEAVTEADLRLGITSPETPNAAEDLEMAPRFPASCR